MSTTLTPLPAHEKKRASLAASPSLVPSRCNELTRAVWFSVALAIAAAIASGIGVFYPDVFRETAWTTGNAQGTALVILAVAVPTVVASMILSARGSRRARIVWLGGLSYILYNSVFFAYGIHFNSLFLLYAAMLGLAFWSVVTLLRAVDREDLLVHFSPRTPVRFFASYLALINVPFVFQWLKDVVPAILGNEAPAGLEGTGMITNPVQMTDFAFSFSLIALAVIWLWRRQSWGYLMAGTFFVYGVIEAVSVGTDQLFGHIHDSSQSAGAVPIFAVLAVLVLVPTIMFLRTLREGHMAARRVAHGRRSGFERHLAR